MLLVVELVVWALMVELVVSALVELVDDALAKEVVVEVVM